MALGALISAGATYLLVLLLLDFLSVRDSAVASRAFTLGLLRDGVRIVAWAGLGLSLAWLLGRIYSVSYFALALLGPRGPQGRRNAGRRAALQRREQ